MSEFKYKHLFEPIQLAGALFRNRIFAAPTGYRPMTTDSVLPLDAAYYYGRKAMGGAASVSTGELIVDSRNGRAHSKHICIDEPLAFMPLARVANTIARFGAVPTAELEHAGMYANRDSAIFGGSSHGVAYGPVTRELSDRTVQEMPEELIEYTISKYAEAALTAKNCGFGMILIHAGHGWLLHQFLSPHLNTRKDKWGGRDIENRARFTIAVCDAVRRAVGPKMPIEVRISGSECYEGGYGIDDGIDFARQLEGHVDLIHVSAGNHEIDEVFTVTHPRMFLGDGCNVYLAAEIKKHVKTPIATIGALGEPEMMEDIIASGKADVVELARSLIADPDLPNKIRSGREDEIAWCMRCLSCFSTQVKYGVKYCAVNPESGRESETLFVEKKAKIKKKVFIAGGGIGGMQAALTCAEYGHEVVLFEKSDELGGAIRCERNVPFKKKLDMYIETQMRSITRMGIAVRLNTALTPALAEELRPDVIIAALGAVPIKPQIAGIDGNNVLDAEAAYINPDKAGESVVILGAGLVGLELGVYLSMLGRKVSVVEMAEKISDGGNFLHVQGLQVELKKRGIDVFLSTRATEITADGVHCQTEAGKLFFPADTVIYAVGQRPRREDALALNFCAPEFYMLGDCVTPANITAATGAAYDISRNIGRF
jgi:2,4-dienoyl-CoA reductase-like NADH-dependent reductase (Old Yellow Enzyme family)/thioredoxin reductase